MDDCCDSKGSELAQLREKQGRVLYIVLAINAVMFVVEFTAGWILHSTALLGDSLDMFGDTLVYTISLFVLHRGARARAGAALFKSGFLLLFSLLIIGEAIRKSFLGVVPEAGWMSLIGLIALAANLSCLALLYSHRSDDINMSSTWLCSRNDVIANLSVLGAAGLVMLTESLWPDLIVGVGLAILYLHSSVQVGRDAWPQWRGRDEQSGIVCGTDAGAPPDSCCGSDAVTIQEASCGKNAVAQSDDCCDSGIDAPADSCRGTNTTDSKTESGGERCARR
ncbi:cation transporter [Marinobacter salarius]|jgi:Co/Zn/Cd efflux system component|uniref:cation transporter n=1 Tax=Marinobacter salarius TaxID=1420917 RepID=UPI0018F1B86B|nr:cation transporter [Marinobacter salarius]MBJ7274880.1 cation transporter [Marinobacter salarius]